jgi:penicillin-binding protein A
MNLPIARLFAVVLLMFALLAAFTSRWTIFDASALKANSLNVRPGLEQRYIPRGSILADDQRTVLAESVRQKDGIYVRQYPFGPLLAPALGYYDPIHGRAGLESFRSAVLTGSPAQQNSIIDQLEGKRTIGDTVVTTLDPHAQQVAYDALAGRPGAVVAIVPSTGAIRVFAGDPTYDPNLVKTNSGFASVQKLANGALLDRAAQGQYAPGSTFKVVTAIAALDSGKYTPSSILSGKSPIVVSGQPLANDCCATYGDVDLTTALTYSINTVWAQVALGVGAPTMQTYMNRLGFYSKPPLDLPSAEIAQSGVVYPRRNGYLPVTSGADLGRVGIGEGGLEVTPVQMAMVASAVANGGRLMVPHLTAAVVNPDGQTIQTIAPQLYSTVMKPSTAQEVGVMMTHVVQEGTGTAAALAGIQVAGKTGTAQDCTNPAVPACSRSQVWFIAFAPANDPKIAIAVTLEHQAGFGGPLAGPIAKAVLQALLGSHA